MMTENFNLLREFENKKNVKILEIGDFLLEYLGLDYYLAWSRKPDPIRLIYIMESYRLSLYNKALSKILSSEVSDNKRLTNMNEALSLMEEADKLIEELYNKLHLIVPIKEHLMELGIMENEKKNKS